MLTLNGLVAGHGGARVLDGIDLALAAGEAMALLGRNGMGKTTLLRTIMGLVPIAAGRVRVAGIDVTGWPAHRIAREGVAYVPQGRGILQPLTVEDNLRLGLIGAGAEDMPKLIGREFPLLAERRRQRAGTLSGGEQQQLAIARALVRRPRLLLLDEPSEGLQPSIVEDLALTLARLRGREGLTILIVEQNLAMVRPLAERVSVIENGRIAFELPGTALAGESERLRSRLAL